MDIKQIAVNFYDLNKLFTKLGFKSTNVYVTSKENKVIVFGLSDIEITLIFERIEGVMGDAKVDGYWDTPFEPFYGGPFKLNKYDIDYIKKEIKCI